MLRAGTEKAAWKPVQLKIGANIDSGQPVWLKTGAGLRLESAVVPSLSSPSMRRVKR